MRRREDRAMRALPSRQAQVGRRAGELRGVRLAASPHADPTMPSPASVTKTGRLALPASSVAQAVSASRSSSASPVVRRSSSALSLKPTGG